MGCVLFVTFAGTVIGMHCLHRVKQNITRVAVLQAASVNPVGASCNLDINMNTLF